MSVSEQISLRSGGSRLPKPLNKVGAYESGLQSFAKTNYKQLVDGINERAALSAVIRDTRPDVVLVDLRMPVPTTGRAAVPSAPWLVSLSASRP